MFHICWGTRASYSETSCDFFKVCFSIRPTDPISGNAFDAKRKKKGDGHNLKLHKRKHSDFTDFTVLSVWKILLSLTTKKQVP